MSVDDLKVEFSATPPSPPGGLGQPGAIGTAASVVLRFTDVFVRCDGRWQIVASHGTMLAP